MWSKFSSPQNISIVHDPHTHMSILDQSSLAGHYHGILQIIKAIRRRLFNIMWSRDLSDHPNTVGPHYLTMTDISIVLLTKTYFSTPSYIDIISFTSFYIVYIYNPVISTGNHFHFPCRTVLTRVLCIDIFPALRTRRWPSLCDVILRMRRSIASSS